ncbi:DUF4249 domain-containing protein [Flavobacterium sp. Fl-77]|uniref:DUF4249 domain-containing protein n=1 Tax=Flavobacterium flavipigmentatum TaxID=2893884 RepID=A0AAJ2SFM0_9FLAO|nr:MULTISPECIES: DUF4249 domain-containing protein [unclassified Flavobacterium]MDX6181963.1 DUF4249 domain-containing protein [Flavobacterium sp. Fl-33]MDX6186982.1 DUF4249 domain-containing protein [Flavobacterium sp. Fl-77]UFH37117.1 DUF4249 domain-containing protein [Flavobacterium sp. F-70]
MKKLHLLIVLFMALFFTNCEEVVDIDLDAAPPKLVIEAAINWEKGTTGTQQTIKLTTTADYFENKVPTVSGATVFVRNSSNQQFNFTEIPETGQYVCNNFIPVIGQTYTLTVISNGNTYNASETFKAVAPITRIEQNNEGGFTGQDIEIKTFYNDPANENNYYLYKYLYSNKVKSNYYADEDKFFEGNEFFSISDDEDLKPGDVIEITHIGISKQYYNYITILVSIAGNSSGGPFQSPPATVRGNIINTTDSANYPLGYFSLSETDSRKYIIE